MLAILAPVPAEILADGFKVKNPEGRVAFGTGTQDTGGGWSYEFFLKPDINQAKRARYRY